MTEKQYQKLVADARRAEGRKYGFRQNTYINFKVEDGYFFCVYFQYGSARLTVKPMYVDDLWWDILGEPENKDKPDSLRGTGEHSLPGQVLVYTGQRKRGKRKNCPRRLRRYSPKPLMQYRSF